MFNPDENVSELCDTFHERKHMKICRKLNVVPNLRKQFFLTIPKLDEIFVISIHQFLFLFASLEGSQEIADRKERCCGFAFEDPEGFLQARDLGLAARLPLRVRHRLRDATRPVPALCPFFFYATYFVMSIWDRLRSQDRKWRSEGIGDLRGMLKSACFGDG